MVEGLTGAQVVVDVSKSPSFEDAAVLQFFQTSTGTLLAAERKAGTNHHVVLSIVGADRGQDSGYMRAKVAQEQLVADGGVPYTIMRATQFFEFLGAIADANTTDGTVRLPSAHLQPIAASDLAVAVADVAVGSPADAVVEVAGPEAVGFGRAGPAGPVRDRRPAASRHRRFREVLRRPNGRCVANPGTGCPHRPNAPERLAQPTLK